MRIKYRRQHHRKIRGSIYIPAIVIITFFMSLGLTVMTYVLTQSRLATQELYRAKAFQIADAGIEYYRWHLAHAQEDFQDGTGAPGPYTHEYTDADGNHIGQFKLTIVAPPVGSTVVDITAHGNSDERTKLTRSVRSVLGRPSFTNYAVVANDNMRFGEGTEVFGPIHSNYGLRFDGVAYNVVSSSEITYDDPDHSGGEEWAVHTHIDPIDSLPPVNPQPPYDLPSRPDVFEAGREVDAKGINFTSISAELDDLQAAADVNGIYLTDSGGEGYHITFNSDGTVSIYKVDSQKTCLRQVCFFFFCWWTNYTSTNLWSVDQQSSFEYNGEDSANLPMPTNGLIFVEDDVWVDGQIDGSRVTVVAAKTPYSTGNANIITNSELRYTNYDGTDAIGLIAQNNIYAGFYSDDNFRVDAAMIAQKGMVGRPYYPASSGTFSPASCNDQYVRDTFSNYGAIATNQRYGYAYVCGESGAPACAPCGTTASGYCYRNLLYDDNFYFSPPPFFPATDQYRVITWEELD